MKTNSLLFAIGAAILTFLAGPPAEAAPGDLDLTFGGTGKVTTAIGSSNDYGNGVVVQNDGKIIVAGSSSNGSNNDFSLVRYNANGSLDTTFGGTGKVTTAIGTGDDSCAGMAVQDDGKILLSGYSHVAGIYAFALVRYNTNGGLDTTFGGTGKVTTDIGTWHDVGGGVAVQSDGKIVVVGYAYIGGGADFAVVRYNADGSLDTTFGGTGKVTTGFAGLDDFGEEVTLQSDGKIVVAGYAKIGTRNDFALVRYNANGTLDTTFGGSGKVTTAIGSGDSFGRRVAMQSDGKIVFAGYRAEGIGLVRYLADGSLDTSFGGTGIVTTSLGSGANYGFSVAVQSDGKILVAGSSTVGSYQDCALVRYNPDGSLDTTFGGTGKVITAIGIGNDQGLSVAVQGNGKIIVAGQSTDGTTALNNYDFAVVRYEGGPFPPFDQWKMTLLSNVNAPDLSDTDRDGLSLLVEYALTLSPTTPTLPPPVERHLYAEGERLRMFFTRDPARNDVTLEVQAADNLAGPWVSVATSAFGGVTSGPGYFGGDSAAAGLKTVEVRDTVNISATSSRYLRLKVTR